MDIKEARKQIDSIDAVLVAEFEKRLSLIKEIGKYKDEHHLPLVDEARDESIVALHTANCKDKTLSPYVENYIKKKIEYYHICYFLYLVYYLFFSYIITILLRCLFSYILIDFGKRENALQFFSLIC